MNMPDNPSEGTRLAARGTPVVLSNGETWHLRYGFDALLKLEEQFGSMDAMQQRLTDMEKQGAGGAGQIRTLLDLIRPGLLEAAEDHGVPYERIGRLLDLAQLPQYLEAFRKSFAESFPTPAAADIAPATGPGSPPAVMQAGLGNPLSPPPSFPGESGTTSPPAGTDALTVSSG